MTMNEKNEQAGELLEREIAERAHRRWILRGRPLGDGREDWFAALAAIEAERERKEHDSAVAVFDS